MAHERGGGTPAEFLSFTDAVRATITASRAQDDPVCVACLGVVNVGRAAAIAGEEAVEAILSELHRALGKSIRGGDVLHRLEGSRFGFVLHGCEGDVLEIIGRRLATQILRVPGASAAEGAELGTSLGIAFFGDTAPTDDDAGASRAIEAAERALAEAESQGPGKVVIRTY